MKLDEAGDVQDSEEQADEKRFALRKSPHTGESGGFTVHAGVTVHAADREGRERLVRYCARPALSMERMSQTRDGLIAYRLRHVQKGKATHRVTRSIDFLARIAAIIPPPGHPLLRYFGVFGPHSSWRRLCVPRRDVASPSESTNSATEGQGRPTRRSSRAEVIAECVDDSAASTVASSDSVVAPRFIAGLAPTPTRIDWATLLKRTYDFDVLQCPCGGRLKVVELVTDTKRSKERLSQFGMSTEPPPIARARSPDWD